MKDYRIEENMVFEVLDKDGKVMIYFHDKLCAEKFINECHLQEKLENVFNDIAKRLKPEQAEKLRAIEDSFIHYFIEFGFKIA
jgi:hypothetical protein